MKKISDTKCFEGRQQVFTHESISCKCEMTFAVYLPPQAKNTKVPCLWFLSGLTCTHENAMTKAGLQKYASDEGLALVFPDTSPRGKDIPDSEDYDLGQGAGFYVDATEVPWNKNFQMYSYITNELSQLVREEFPVNENWGITGHSMGGHGALTIGLKNLSMFKSISAFAPISNPLNSDWGKKQLTAYLGERSESWDSYDASTLLRESDPTLEILVDQGTSDNFLELLMPESLTSCNVRMQEGYDHSYFFISTFGGEHVRWHAEQLKN